MAASNSSFVSVRQFADAVGVDPSTVSRWCSSGRIRSVKLGASKQALRRIPRRELERTLRFGFEGRE